ncbi:MAG: DUF1653 domain-containing protein [bacterium]|nr:DUF1653 domain-containing protein [bacterium]
MESEPRPGIYRHFKGGKYLVFWVSTDVESGEQGVEYSSLYGPHVGKHARRPLKNFLEEVDRPELNYKGPRFRSMESFEKMVTNLKLLLPKICGRETSADPGDGSEANPLWGHCAVVALLTQDLFGGELLRASLDGTPFADMRSHYWNQLPGGMELDLTAPQFGDNYPIGLQPETRTRSYVLSNPDTKARYELLKQKFTKAKPPE